MKALKIIGIILAVIVGSIIVLGLIAPKDFNYSKSVVVNASPEVVYKNISTFEAFNKWNPWSKKDPNQVVSLEGTDGTVGAKHSWKGNKEVGEGSMTITKLEEKKYVEYDLHFIAPFEAHNVAYMEMAPENGGQKVVWGMKGTSPFPFNVMGLFMNMEKMMGKDFEEGLNSLKEMSEAEGNAGVTAYEVKEVDWTEKNCLAVRKTVEFKDISSFLVTNYGKIHEAITKAGATAGTPLGIYYKYDEKEMKADMAAAIPYNAKKNFGKGFEDIKLPATKAYMVDYYGAYDQMKPAYDALMAKIIGMGINEPDMAIEEYLNDPMTEKDPAKLHTAIYFIVKQPMAAK